MDCIVFIPQVASIDLQIAIDFCAFEVKAGNAFGGIKNVPKGIHVISFSSHHSGSLEESGRYGFWFETGNCHDNLYIQFDESDQIFKLKQEADDGKFLDISRRCNAFMLNYPQVEDIEDGWSKCTEYIRKHHIDKILSSYPGYVDSSMTSIEESRLLNHRLNQDMSSDSPCFRYTAVAFKSKDAIRKSHEMEDFLDKSHYLNEKIIKRDYHGHVDRLFGELQMAFLNLLLFGNYGSSLQWHNLIELVCSSAQVSLKTIQRLDSCLSLQAGKLTDEYHVLLNENVWRRCLTDSFQSENLPRTRKAIQQAIPELQNSSDSDAFNNNSDEDEDDAYRPTIAGGVYYRRP